MHVSRMLGPLVALAAFGSLGWVDDPIICGWVVTTSCPGCTASVPADSTCGCGHRDDGCDCVKQSGGIQFGIIVECETDAFNYFEDLQGFVISKVGTASCKRIKKCWKAGAQGVLDCATWDEQLQMCVSGVSCEWQEWTSTMQDKCSQGASCSIE